jgi:hypothetical protein
MINFLKYNISKKKNILPIFFILIILTNIQISISKEYTNNDSSNYPNLISEVEDSTNISFNIPNDFDPYTSIEDDLQIESIKNLTISIIFAVGVLLLIVVLWSLRKINPLIALILMAAVLFLYLVFMTLVLGEDTILSSNIENYNWKDTSISTFDKSFEYNNTKQEPILNSELNKEYQISDDFIDEIIFAKKYTQKDEKTLDNLGESTIIEFSNTKILSQFVNKYLFPLNELYFPTETIYNVNSNSNLLSNSYYDKNIFFTKNRFLFLISGNDQFVSNSINNIVDKYPKIISTHSNKIKIELVNLNEEGYANNPNFIFEVTDKDGINLDSIEIIEDYELYYNSRTNCEKIKNGFSCFYSKGNFETDNDFVIIASDNLNNKGYQKINYKVDTTKPNFKFQDSKSSITLNYYHDVDLIFYVEDKESGINYYNSFYKFNERKESIKKYCSSQGYCKIPLSKLSEFNLGKNIFELFLFDYADNLNENSNKEFIYDNLNPKIKLINPKNNSFISNNKVNFLLQDFETGIKMSSIEIINLDSNVTYKNQFIIFNCEKRNENEIYCNFLIDSNKKHQNYIIKASDNANNFVFEEIDFFYDNINPIIKVEEINVNNNDFSFEIIDNYGFLDMESLNCNEIIDFVCSNCELISKSNIKCKGKANFLQGDNLVSISIRDNAGNLGNYEQYLVFDTVKPVLSNLKLNYNEYGEKSVVFDIWDNININKISIGNIVYYDIDDYCVNYDLIDYENTKYCSFPIKNTNSNILSIKAYDKSNNYDIKSINLEQ